MSERLLTGASRWSVPRIWSAAAALLLCTFAAHARSERVTFPEAI